MDYERWKRENWNRAHRENDLTALTGSDLAEHLRILETVDLLKRNQSVLCIGVGTGVWVCELAEKCYDVWALDISPVAAGKVEPVGIPFVTSAAALPSDRFDLAMSLWVASHMSDHDLEVQLREVIRALKPSGVFAIHYKEPLDDNALLDNRIGAEDEWRVARAAMMLRRRRHFDAMVRWAGGRVIDHPKEAVSRFYKIIEVSAHITKWE